MVLSLADNAIQYLLILMPSLEITSVPIITSLVVGHVIAYVVVAVQVLLVGLIIIYHKILITLILLAVVLLLLMPVHYT